MYFYSRETKKEQDHHKSPREDAVRCLRLTAATVSNGGNSPGTSRDTVSLAEDITGGSHICRPSAPAQSPTHRPGGTPAGPARRRRSFCGRPMTFGPSGGVQAEQESRTRAGAGQWERIKKSRTKSGGHWPWGAATRVEAFGTSCRLAVPL